MDTDHDYCTLVCFQESQRCSPLLHHVLDEHEWVTGACEHEQLVGPPTDQNGKELRYFVKNEPAFKGLQKLIMDTTWLKSLKFLTKFRHTGQLESFHNVILAYAPKRAAFQNQSYQARIQLSVLDYNAHINRDKAKNKEGSIIYARKFRKQTKKWDASATLKKKFSYIPNLMKQIESQWCTSSCSLKDAVRSPYDEPARILENTQPVSTAEIVSTKASRFDRHNN